MNYTLETAIAFYAPFVSPNIEIGVDFDVESDGIYFKLPEKELLKYAKKLAKAGYLVEMTVIDGEWRLTANYNSFEIIVEEK